MRSGGKGREEEDSVIRRRRRSNLNSLQTFSSRKLSQPSESLQMIVYKITNYNVGPRKQTSQSTRGLHEGSPFSSRFVYRPPLLADYSSLELLAVTSFFAARACNCTHLSAPSAEEKRRNEPCSAWASKAAAAKDHLGACTHAGTRAIRCRLRVRENC